MEDRQPLVKEEQPPSYNQATEATTGDYPSASPMSSADQYPQHKYGATSVGVSAPAAAYTQDVMYMQTPPRDYMCLSVVTLFFCWPLALLAMFKSCESQKAMRQGDILRASRAGEVAKKIAVGAISAGSVLIGYVVGRIVFEACSNNN